MKIFVSYSRRDADLAQHVHEYFMDSEHEVFTDVNNIQMGDIWSNIIENNISKCDIFIVIVTHASLRSIEIEKEVLQAQRENRTIIPCIHRDVSHGEIKWDLAKYQGIEFEDKYELARSLFSRIERSTQKGHKANGISSKISLETGSNSPDKDTQQGDKIPASQPSLARSIDTADSSSINPLIPQTKSQPEAPKPLKQEPPKRTSQQQQSESSMPQRPEGVGSSTLPYQPADSIDTTPTPTPTPTPPTTTRTPPSSTSPITTKTEDSHYNFYHQEAEKGTRSGINLKILLPIVGVVAIVGAVVAFTFLGTTEQPPVTQPVPPTPPNGTEVPNFIPVTSNQYVTTNTDTPVNIALAASDNDTSDDLTANIVSMPYNGKLSVIDQSTGFVTYTPDPGFVGDDQFTYKVNDGKADSTNTGIVKVSVKQEQEQQGSVSASNISNHPPIPSSQFVTTGMNTPIDIALGASDQDKNDDLTAAIISDPLHENLGEVDQSSGVVVYTPNLGFTGNDEFTFKVNDGKADSSNPAKVSITVK